MTANMFEPDVEEVTLVTFDLSLTPIEIGMIQMSLRSQKNRFKKQRESLQQKMGDDFDPSITDEKLETIDSINRKIRKAGYG